MQLWGYPHGYGNPHLAKPTDQPSHLQELHGAAPLAALLAAKDGRSEGHHVLNGSRGIAWDV